MYELRASLNRSIAMQGKQAKIAQFIIICRWLQLIHKDRLAPLENTPFSTLWARKRYRVAQRFRQYLRATNCYKLSVAVYIMNMHLKQRQHKQDYNCC